MADRLKLMQARIAELERSEQLLRALDQASAAMIGALDPGEVIDAIGGKLVDLGLQTVVLRKDADDLLRVVKLNMSSALIRGIERRVGIQAKEFTIDYHRVDFYRRIVEERRAIYVEDTFEIASTVLPRLAAPLVRFVLDRLGMSQMIGAPLVVGDDVWGAFIISSVQLTASDVAAVRLFAHQVGWALHKTRLVSRLRDTVTRMETTQAQLVQSQKMEALGRLTGGIAHDLNNLLTGILMSADLARLDVPEGSPALTELANIEQTSQRASDLIAQLMAFSRRQAIRKSLLDLSDVLEQLRPLLRRVIGEDIELRIALEPDSACRCCIDRTQLEQVIINLVVNASDAMPSGGELTLRTRQAVPSPRNGEPTQKPMVCLSVEDTGVGIPAEIQPRLFDPFFTTKPREQGTGLGLSVAYGIVRQHDGWIDVHSEVGSGSRFDVWLPGGSDEESSDVGDDPQSGDSELQLPEQIGRILLVEDAAHLRDVVERCLRRVDAQLWVATTVQEAKAIVETRTPDVVICDVVLPDGSGLDLCESLHRRFPGVAIVLVSGYTDRRVDVSTMESRGWVFLPKPFSVRALLQALRRTRSS